MNCTEAHASLDDSVDGTLSPVESLALDAHLARCPRCREALASLRALRDAAASLPHEITPGRDLWPEIVAATAARPAPSRRLTLPLALAAAAVVVLVAIGAWSWQHRATRQPGWTVAPLAGTPHVGATPISGDARLRPGDWLETDDASRARLDVGAIGEVRLEANSRVRFVGTAANQHRLELARGTLHALIWSPPRLFFVDTPAATAIDLGCAYTLAVDAEGHGIVRVTAGYVALENGPRTVVVPAGMMCAARRGTGPGTPFAADASPALRAALDRFDFHPAERTAALDEILRESRREDSVTLWHLLSQVPAGRRGDVFDQLAALHPPPEEVTREGILRADAVMLTRWAGELGLIAASDAPYRGP
ncbi:MAG TPA: zf-HC2 domain-containing protein [Opitutaceae bacterium]